MLLAFLEVLRVLGLPDGGSSKSMEAGWYIAGNLLVGGILGWLIVDPLSGAMWTLSPAQVDARLETSMHYDRTGVMVALADQVPSDVLAMATPVTRRE